MLINYLEMQCNWVVCLLLILCHFCLLLSFIVKVNKTTILTFEQIKKCQLTPGEKDVSPVGKIFDVFTGNERF